VLGTLDYTFKYGGYHDHVGLSTTKRDDNLHQLNLKLSYLFSKKSQIYLSDTYYRNISNYTPSEYTKNSLMLGLSYTY
jgi:predicted porin